MPAIGLEKSIAWILAPLNYIGEQVKVFESLGLYEPKYEVEISGLFLMHLPIHVSRGYCEAIIRSFGYRPLCFLI